MKRHLLSILVLYLAVSTNSFSQQENTTYEQKKYAEIKFEEPDFDFGTVESGKEISHVFNFTNIGEVPLIITRAVGSCKCTIPYYPKDPVWPGDTSEIEIVFDTKGRNGAHSKRVTIYANTESGYNFVTMKGDISKVEKMIDFKEKRLIEQGSDVIEVLDRNCSIIYSNPLNKNIQLELKEYISKVATIEIRNEAGEKIIDKTIGRISKEATFLDIKDFSSGTYIVTIFIDNEEPINQCFIVTD